MSDSRLHRISVGLAALRGPVVSFVVEAIVVVLLAIAAVAFALLALWWV